MSFRQISNLQAKCPIPGNIFPGFCCQVFGVVSNLALCASHGCVYCLWLTSIEKKKKMASPRAKHVATWLQWAWPQTWMQTHMRSHALTEACPIRQTLIAVVTAAGSGRRQRELRLGPISWDESGILASNTEGESELEREGGKEFKGKGN